MGQIRLTEQAKLDLIRFVEAHAQTKDGGIDIVIPKRYTMHTTEQTLVLYAGEDYTREVIL